VTCWTSKAPHLSVVGLFLLPGRSKHVDQLRCPTWIAFLPMIKER